MASRSSRRIQTLAWAIVLAVLAGGWWLLRHDGRSTLLEGAEPAERVELDSASLAGRELSAEPAARADATAKAPAAERAPIEAFTPATLLVKVVADGSNVPLSGVRAFAVRNATAGAAAEVIADEKTGRDGRASLSVPSGVPIRLTARGSGIDVLGESTREIEPLAPGEELCVTFVFSVGPLRFFGRALTSVGRAPVPGAVVWVTGRGGDFDAETHTDASGRFAVGVASEAGQLVRVTADGLGTTVVPMSTGHDRPERELVIELQPEAAIRGRVLDSSGEPALGRIECALEPSIPGFHTWTEELGAEGRFLLRSLPPERRLRLSVHAPRERWSEPLLLVAGEQQELEIALADGVAVHGIAIDRAGEPVPELRLWLMRPSPRGRYFEPYQDPTLVAVTRGDGRFTIPDVPPGSWLLGPAPPGQSDVVYSPPDPDRHERAASIERHEKQPAPFAVPLEVPAGADLQDVVLQVARGLRIRGKVIDSDGEPIVQATVRARLGDLEIEHGVHNRDGAFVLGPLPDARFTITAELDGGATTIPTTAQAGENDLVLQVERAASALRVLAPVAAGTEIVLARRDVLSRPLRARTRHGGTAAFERVWPGIYDASLATSDGRWGGASALSPTTDETIHELALESAATIDVAYMGPGSEVVLRALRGEQIVACVVTRGGSTARLVVPPGPIQLQLWLRHGTLVRDVEAVLDAPLDVLLP